MSRKAHRSHLLTAEILEDRITPTITFGSGTSYETGSDPTAIATGDLTGNGINDIVVGNAGDGIEIWLGDGHGNFTLDGTISPGFGVTMLELADLKGNGILDIVGGNDVDHELFVAMGNGNGTFDITTLWSSPYGCGAMAMGDLNNDGLPDLEHVQ